MTAVATATRVRSVNPATLDVVWETPVASEDEIARTVTAETGEPLVAAVVGTGNGAVLKPSELTPLPGGDRKGSGYGRTHGLQGLRELLYRKAPGARVRGAAAHRGGLARLTQRYLGRR